jgi:hypothetical protein
MKIVFWILSGKGSVISENTLELSAFLECKQLLANNSQAVEIRRVIS